MAEQKYRRRRWDDETRDEREAKKKLSKDKKHKRQKVASKKPKAKAPPITEPMPGPMMPEPMMRGQPIAPGLAPTPDNSLGMMDENALPMRGGRRSKFKRPLTRIERNFLNG